jgi:hypothetical protein
MNLLKKGTKIKRKMENLMGKPLPSRYNDKKEEDNFQETVFFTPRRPRKA